MQEGLRGSALAGMCGTLPGGPVKVGDSWTRKDTFLYVKGGEDPEATFTLKEIVTEDGEECARIVGTLSGKSKFECETIFSLARRVPLKSTLSHEAGDRTTRIETRLVEFTPAK